MAAIAGGGTGAGGAAIFLEGDFFPWGEGLEDWTGRDFGAGFFFFNCGAGFFILFAGLIAFLTPGFPARTGAAGFRVGFLRWAIIVSLEGSGDSGE